MTAYRRLVVVGGPGSGKSTLARTVAERIACPYVELDQLWWRPGWTTDRAGFVQKVGELVRTPRWVCDGNYFEEAAPLLWPVADAVVWLDPPRRVAVRRAVVRTAARLVTGEVLWNGNRERWANLSPVSIVSLARRWSGYSARIARLTGELAGDQVVRLSSPGEMSRWLAQVMPDT